MTIERDLNMFVDRIPYILIFILMYILYFDK